MPDLDILIEMADYFDVDLRELLDGERRSERMNEEFFINIIKRFASKSQTFAVE